MELIEALEKKIAELERKVRKMEIEKARTKRLKQLGYKGEKCPSSTR